MVRCALRHDFFEVSITPPGWLHRRDGRGRVHHHRETRVGAGVGKQEIETGKRTCKAVERLHLRLSSHVESLNRRANRVQHRATSLEALHGSLCFKFALRVDLGKMLKEPATTLDSAVSNSDSA
eukprot:2493070-Rhodomonas_salina.1